MRRWHVCVCGLAFLGACAQLFGLDSPSNRASDAPVVRDAPAHPDAHDDALVDAHHAADAVGAAPTFVQEAGGSGNASVSVSFTNPTVPGDMLVAVLECQGASLAGGGVTTWMSATSNGSFAIEYGIVTTAASSVDVNCTVGALASSLDVTEWHGAKKLDAANNATGSTSAASASLTTSDGADAVVFAVYGNASGTPTPGTWTALMREADFFGAQAQWYSDTAAPTTLTPSVTASGSWVAVIAAFR